MQPDAIHYENAHRNTFIAFLLKHDGHQKSIKSRDFSDFRNVAQFERPFFVRTDKFNLHEINNLFIFYCLVKRQCPLFCKFRLVKAMCFTSDFHTQRCAPLHHRFFGVTAGTFTSSTGFSTIFPPKPVEFLSAVVECSNNDKRALILHTNPRQECSADPSAGPNMA